MDSLGQIGSSSLLDSFPKNRKNFRTVVLRGHMPHKLHTIVSGGVTVARELRVTHGPYRVWAFFAEEAEGGGTTNEPAAREKETGICRVEKKPSL